MPPGHREHYPMVLNMWQHGGIAAMLWLDALVCRKRVYRKRAHFGMSYAVAVAYEAWSLLCAFMNGSHTYPFMNHFTPLQHVLFFGAVLGFGLCVLSAVVLIIGVLQSDKDAKKLQ